MGFIGNPKEASLVIGPRSPAQLTEPLTLSNWLGHPPGPIIATWEIDHENYRARAIMSDGSDGGTLDLRSLFEQFHTEAR
jgi:hypothetical protein